MLFLLFIACERVPEPEPAALEPVAPAYVLALHGGAGPAKRNDPERRAAYVAALKAAATDGCTALAAGRSALDVVEQVVRTLEDDPHFNAGKGAVLTEDGRHELDASIMDGSTLACGAVAGVTTIEHPISAARGVMEKTRHVLLVSDGAETFAAEELGLTPVENGSFTTDYRKESLRRRLESQEADEGGGTVGAVALDNEGHLAAATSTGGLTAKKWGRIGDSPIIGAGTYADDRTVAVSATGTGEEFIRHGVAKAISDRVALLDESAVQAAGHLVNEVLRPGDGGVIVVSSMGEVAMPYSTGAMLRATCGEGRDVQVFIEDQPE